MRQPATCLGGANLRVVRLLNARAVVACSEASSSRERRQQNIVRKPSDVQLHLARVAASLNAAITSTLYGPSWMILSPTRHLQNAVAMEMRNVR